MTTVNKIRVNFVRRAIPRRGPFSTESYNAAMEELAVDLADFGARWNTDLYPMLNGLPRGTDETRWTPTTPANTPNPLVDGLDGDNMFVDNAASTTQDDGLFWSTTENRPKTIRESSRDIDDRVTDIYSELSESLLDVSNGLSSDQWNRLGMWVKDGTASLESSVSYKARTGWTNMTTLMADMYNTGSSYLGTLETSGFTIQNMLSDLLTEHGAIWNTDTSSTIDHSGISGIVQVSVDNSASYAQKTRGGATHLEHDMNHLRWEIARIKLGAATTTSTSQWSSDVTDPVGAGVASLKDHIEYDGAGTPDASNPHGLHRQDVDGVDTEFGYNNTFTGKSGLGTETPTYSSTTYVSDTDSLETAIGKLDAGITALAGSVREVYTFTSHNDVNVAIVITHNKGTAGVSNSTWPLVQVVDTGTGGDYGVLADEVYGYEQEHGIVTTDAFVSIEFIDFNTFHVYTSLTSGKIIAVF